MVFYIPVRNGQAHPTKGLVVFGRQDCLPFHGQVGDQVLVVVDHVGFLAGSFMPLIFWIGDTVGAAISLLQIAGLFPI